MHLQISIVVLMFTLGASSVHAQADEPQSTDLERAERALQEGRLAEACALFARVQALVPDARATAGLGQCALGEGDVEDAFVLLSDALAMRDDPLTGEAHARATAALRRAGARIGRLRIEPSRRDAEVRIGGAEPVVREGVMLVEAGTYFVVVIVPGFEPWQDQITVVGGRETRVRIRLVRERPSEGVLASPTPGAPVRDTSRDDENVRLARSFERAGTPLPIRVSPRPPTIVGNLPDPSARRVIYSSRGRFEQCARLAGVGGVQGVITLGFSVDARGLTTAASIVSTTVLDEAVQSCFIEVVREMRFPDELGRAPVRITVPIALGLAD